MSKTLAILDHEQAQARHWPRLGMGALPLAVFCGIFGLNLLTVWIKNFDGLYGQDAYSYFAHAGELHNNLSLFHHWQWEDTPRLLFWPAGYPVALAIIFWLTGPSAGAGQLVCLLAWSGAAALVTSIGQKLAGNWWVGLAAGTLLGLSALGRQAAVSVMADSPAVFWTVLAVWLILVARQKKQGWYLVTAGLSLGLAGSTRYAALTAVPLLVCGMLERPLSGKIRLILPVKWLVLAVGAVGLVGLPQFVINQLYPDPFWTSSWLADWSPLNMVRSEFTTRDGFAAYPTPPPVFYLGFALVNPRLLAGLALPLAGAGIFYLGRQKRGFELIFLGAWWLLPVLLFSGIPYESERFSLTFLPPLALLAGFGLAWLGRVWLSKAWLGRFSQAGLGLALLVGVAGLIVVSQRHLDGFIALKDDDLAVVRQVESRLPAQANLITFSLSLTFDHYTGLRIYDLSLLDAGKIAGLVKQKPVYLLANADEMARQWQGNPVGRAFEAAQSYAAGPPLARYGRYTLWELGR